VPSFKTVWQFIESNGSTFSEVWYKDAQTISTVVDPNSTSVKTRLTFLHPLNTLVRIRVSQVLTLRNTQNVLISLNGSAPGTQGPLPAGASLVLNVAGVGGGSKKWWMRGNAKDDYTRDAVTGKDSPNPQFIAQMKVMFGALAQDGYGILRQTPIANPATQIAKVTNVDGMTSPGNTILTTSINLNVQAGQQVVLTRFNPKDWPRLNGRFTVLAAAANSITINYTTPNNSKAPVNSGFAKALVFDATHVVDPTKSGFDHMGTRTSKSPLFGSRGAKRAQRIRQLA
jgi:hypothetical protein